MRLVIILTALLLLEPLKADIMSAMSAYKNWS